jgi:hypothetical protein
MANRLCTKCKSIKPIEEFYLNCYGRNGACKTCVSAKNKVYYEAKRRDIAAKHAERRVQGAQRDEGALERRRETPFYERYAERREKVNENKRDRLRHDPAFRAVVNADNAMRRAFASEGELLEKRVGCSAEWFHEWIEFQLSDNMTPDNYRTVWTYDHVIPKDAFDFHDPAQVRQCNFWTNWRPYLGTENSIKHSKRDLALEESHAMLAYIFQLIQDAWLLRGNNA